MNQPVDDGISSLVALSGESLVMSGEALQKFRIAALGGSIGVIPLKIQNEVIGLLIAVRKTDRELARDTQTLLEAIADYASISLVNARLFAALQQSAENARGGEKNHHNLLESLRASIHEEVQAASYPLNLVITGGPGPINSDQRKALESVQAALGRLEGASEKIAASAALHPKT
jgi:GAF domain-containing protein